MEVKSRLMLVVRGGRGLQVEREFEGVEVLAVLKLLDLGCSYMVPYFTIILYACIVLYMHFSKCNTFN